MTIKRLLGGLCLLVGIAIATSQTANAWQIQNNYQDGIHIYCGNCTTFGNFSQKDVKLGEIVYCDGAEEGCKGQSAADGRAAITVATGGSGSGACIGYFEIPDLINPQGKIVFNASSYTVYDNEMDVSPAVSNQQYPLKICGDYSGSH